MRRFRGERPSRRAIAHPALRRHAGVFLEIERRDRWTQTLDTQWAALHRVCTDLASRTHLARLVQRLTGHDRGARESALAELELATLLIRAGFRIGFLPESQAKTADLQCVLDRDRFFVEITALVGSRHRSHRPWTRRGRNGEDEQSEERGEVLMGRLLARISQKARQLVHYCAPVVLAITVPRQDWLPQRMEQALDLKRLAGAITVLLPRVRHLSAVLLSLWDVEPLPSRSGVRLANVHVVERSQQQAASPRIRALVINPAAGYALSGPELQALKTLL